MDSICTNMQNSDMPKNMQKYVLNMYVRAVCWQKYVKYAKTYAIICKKKYGLTMQNLNMQK